MFAVRESSSMHGFIHWRLWQKLRQLFHAAATNSARAGSSDVKPALWDRAGFAARLSGIGEAPVPLRVALLTALKPYDAVRLLIFGPTQRMVGDAKPASLLAILERAWVVVIFCEAGRSQVYRCDFDDTLLVEMTDILLYGKLRFDFIEDGQIQTVAIFFNTVTCNLYQDAVRLLLDGMDGNSQFSGDESRCPHPALKALSLKFQNGVAKHLPPGRRALEVIHSPEVRRRRYIFFRHQLSPEGVLILTDKLLLFISEESAQGRRSSYETSKYGWIITYCPLSRVQTVCSKKQQFLDVIDVTIRGRRSGLIWRIGFSPERAKVSGFAHSVIHSSAFFESRREFLRVSATPDSRNVNFQVRKR
jgi:hypothetical protein